MVLEIVTRKSGVLRNAGQHSGANLIPIVKCKHVIREAGPLQNPVRTRLPLNGPASTQQKPPRHDLP
jgi:hypothetical protein